MAAAARQPVRLSSAIAAFWLARERGTQSATHDRVFLALLQRELGEHGWPAEISTFAGSPRTIVSGHFRPAKSWDIVARDGAGAVRICVEFKSQVDSYGNNENNRYEEALGSGLDARARHGPTLRMGFVLVLCEEPATQRFTRDRVPDVDPAFVGTSHVQRRELFARRIVDFAISNMPFYNASAVLFVQRDGTFRSPDDPDLDIHTFVDRLVGDMGETLGPNTSS